MVDLRITHDRFGSSSVTNLNGHVHYLNDLYGTLNVTDGSSRVCPRRTHYGLHNGMLSEAIRVKVRDQEWIPTELCA